MILCRSSLMFHLQISSIRSQLFSHFKRTHSFCTSTSPSLVKVRFFSLTHPRQRQSMAFGSAVTAVADTKGRDTFLAEENVSWNSLGLSDTISRALSDIGLDRPSLVQVPFYFFFLSAMSLVSIRATFVVAKKLNDPIFRNLIFVSLLCL